MTSRYSDQFDHAFDKLIAHEGGYVDHPDDPGGETKYGISKRQYPDLNIRALTRDEAKAIYYRDYWERSGADAYAPIIAFNVFDAGVNHGIGNAIRMLQRAVGVADDGVAGKLTKAAVDHRSKEQVVMAFNAERLRFYAKLSSFATFGRGWTRRVADNLTYNPGK